MSYNSESLKTAAKVQTAQHREAIFRGLNRHFCPNLYQSSKVGLQGSQVPKQMPSLLHGQAAITWDCFIINTQRFSLLSIILKRGGQSYQQNGVLHLCAKDSGPKPGSGHYLDTIALQSSEWSIKEFRTKISRTKNNKLCYEDDLVLKIHLLDMNQAFGMYPVNEVFLHLG